MKKLVLVTASLCALGGTAAAQDMGMGGGTDNGGTMNTDMGGGDESSMGIEVDYNAVGDSSLVHFLYNLGGNWLDIAAGIGITNTSPDVGDSNTEFSLGLIGGYRMYNDMNGRVHPYLEPYLRFALFNDSDDTTPNTTLIGAGAMLGVDFMVFPQFSLGAAIGGGVDFQIISDPAKATVFSLSEYTTSLNATIWW